MYFGCFQYLLCEDWVFSTSMWRAYFNKRGLAYTLAMARNDCATRLNDGTEWSGIILAEQGDRNIMTIPSTDPAFPSEEAKWAAAHPQRPVILHDFSFTDGSFHNGTGNFTNYYQDRVVGVINYSQVAAVPGGSFDSPTITAPLSLSNPGYELAFSVTISALADTTGDFVMEASNNKDGNAAIARNGNIWAVGPLTDTVKTPSDAFPWLDIMLAPLLPSPASGAGRKAEGVPANRMHLPVVKPFAGVDKMDIPAINNLGMPIE
ncbi:hypothetical protein JKP88DRAFT_285698 [Tribonema minus]|uniref:Uncharacterized protein n=1 Tax=Tribonema minus TaxID=303371 RepID=A0A836CLI1_9STRA|nr:hypothetical protein JKP88DRAFT_285698 [Tribonema minus]